MDKGIEVAVLLIFFARPKMFQQVFEQVAKAKPSILFLYQDGPREGREDDVINIKKCREIAENITWECEVHKLYQEENIGCDPSEYIAQKWAFSHVNKCIILEDDDVPAISFFPFCKVLLDKYENDERISMISGFNLEEVTKDVPYDYFFTSHSSVSGWASWRRVIQSWDPEYGVLEDDFNRRQIEGVIKQKKLSKSCIPLAYRHADSGKAYYETLLKLNQYLNSGLTIVPTKNMINNIGVDSDSTHFSGSVAMLPRGYRRVFTMPRYEIEGELRHPKYVIEYVEYKIRVYRILAWGHPVIKLYRFIESLFYKLIRGQYKEMLCEIQDRFHKLVKGEAL